MRLNKFLAQATGVSRRQADQLVEASKVMVDGKLGRVGQDIEVDSKVTVSGELVALVAFEYVMFNKPVGYVCSRKSQGKSPTIYTVLPEKHSQLKPVGRLDKDSSGLLLLTNDGDFSQQMTHPKFQKTKVYTVQLDRELSVAEQQHIEQGIALDDGQSRLGLSGSKTNWTVTMQEGRNRQIRRTFRAQGITVTKLHRTHLGPYKLADLPSGHTKIVSRQ